MKFRIFGFGRADRKSNTDRPRYVSSLQRDVQRYAGWTEDNVRTDYRASKSVHTIMTLGYMEYSDGILVLTQKGRMLMQNVAMPKATAND